MIFKQFVLNFLKQNLGIDSKNLIRIFEFLSEILQINDVFLNRRIHYFIILFKSLPREISADGY